MEKDRIEDEIEKITKAAYALRLIFWALAGLGLGIYLAIEVVKELSR